MTTLTDILDDAHWLCVGFNPRERKLHFLRADDATIERCVFLDQRVLDFSKTTAFALAEVHAKRTEHRAPPALVLHTAFCCSTLLGRCLPLPGRAQVLRELTVYAGLPTAKEHPSNDLDAREWSMLVDCVAWLSSRTFGDGARAINKPTNLALPAAADLLATHEHARAVLIYSDLADFLVSNSKKGAESRPRLVTMYRALDPRARFAASRLPQGLDALDHLQLAALIWHAEMAIVATLRADADASRKLRAVDAQDFLAQPEAVVAAAQRWFGIEPDRDATRARLAVELGRHAKDEGGAPFDAARRKHEEQVARQYFGEHVDAALAWSDRQFGPWREAMPALDALR